MGKEVVLEKNTFLPLGVVLNTFNFKVKKGSLLLRGHRHLTENRDLRLWVQSMPAIFQPQIDASLLNCLSEWESSNWLYYELL